ncbi:MAG: VCBS repeat-containing protein, partial [Acidobacteriota bacterium]
MKPKSTGCSLLFLLLTATPALAVSVIRVAPCRIAIANGDKAEDLFITPQAEQIFFLGKSAAYTTKDAITDDDRKVLSDARKQCAADLTTVLQRPLRIPAASARPASRWAIADLNNDGRLDSVIAAGTEVIVQMAQTDRRLDTGTRLNLGSLTHIYSTVSIADVNADGKPDLILCCTALGLNSKLAVSLGNGDGTFQTARESIPAVGAFAVTDWNGDGRPDVLTITPAPSLTLAVGQPDGTFQVAESQQADGLSVTIADVTGDQRPDAIVLSATAVTIFPAQADRKFGTSVSTNLFFNHAQSLSVADFTGDGRLDLAVSHQFGLGEILTNNQNATFLRTGVFSTGQFARSFAADLNDDGIPELLLPDTAGGGTQLVLVNPAGRPIASPLYGIAPGGNVFPDYDPTRSAIAIADFNRDLKPDIALIAGTQNSAALLVFNGANGVANLTATPVILNPISGQRVFIQSLLAVDYDGDLRPDLVALEAETQSLWLFRNTLQGGFEPPVVIPLGSQPR